MVRGLRRDRDTVVGYNLKNPVAAVVTPAGPALDNILSVNSYQKGGWVLHMPRRKVGDEASWRGLSACYARFRNANAQTFTFHVDHDVQAVTLDPNTWLLADFGPFVRAGR